MDTKVLIDTNILIYAFDKESPFHQKSIEVFEQVYNESLDAYIAEKSVYEFISSTSSKAYRDRATQDSIKEFVTFFTENADFTILFSNKEILHSSLQLSFSTHTKKKYIFDMNLASIAIHNKISTIYTKNVKDFASIPLLEAIDPTAKEQE